MINWLKEGRACKEGIDWCKENCGTMEDVWDKLKRVDWLVWVATREGVLTDKELRLFACFCARQNWNLLTDERSRNAIEVAERFANGKATKEELKAAYVAAYDAAYADAAYDAYARAAARAAAVAAYAARVAARVADAAYADAAYAYDAARAADAAYAARVASAAAAYPAHVAAAGKEQMEWLRANTTPNFGGTK